MTTKTTTTSLSDTAAKRAKEVLELAANPQGTRERIYRGLAEVRSLEPKLADQLEEHYLARVQFLAERAPKQVDPPLFMKAKWKPSDAEATKFARYWAAAENPERLVDELSTGRVAAETLEAVKSLYPRYYQEVREQIIQSLAEATDGVSHARRVAIMRTMEIETEPTMGPRFANNIKTFLDAKGEEQQQDMAQKTGQRGGYMLSRKINPDKSPMRPTGGQKQGG